MTYLNTRLYYIPTKYCVGPVDCNILEVQSPTNATPDTKIDRFICKLFSKMFSSAFFEIEEASIKLDRSPRTYYKLTITTVADEPHSFCITKHDIESKKILNASITFKVTKVVNGYSLVSSSKPTMTFGSLKTLFRYMNVLPSTLVEEKKEPVTIVELVPQKIPTKKQLAAKAFARL